jgi:hypothetical protein
LSEQCVNWAEQAPAVADVRHESQSGSGVELPAHIFTHAPPQFDGSHTQTTSASYASSAAPAHVVVAVPEISCEQVPQLEQCEAAAQAPKVSPSSGTQQPLAQSLAEVQSAWQRSSLLKHV